MSTTRRSFWRTCRICFRWVRITVWLIILLFLGVLIYLNQVGLPNFAKKPLLENLRTRGLDFQFSRLRLRWFRGFVAEDARFGRPDEPLSPHLTVKELQLRFNHRALARLRFQIDALLLRQGRLVWPLAETNHGPRELAIENIHSYLRFSPSDQWDLDDFTAVFAGVKFDLSGVVANASAVADWKLFQPRQRVPAGAWRGDLRKLADTLQRIHFSGSPQVRIDVRGDAREPTSFTARVVLNAPDADTPWGQLTGGHVIARLYPASTNGLSRADLNLEADSAQTRWGRAASLQLTAHLASLPDRTNLAQGDLNLWVGRAEAEWGSSRNLQCHVHFGSPPGETNLINAELSAAAREIESRWASTTNARLNVQWTHALLNPIPLAGEGQFQCDNTTSRWVTATGVRFNARMASPSSAASAAGDPSWGWWAKLAPYALDWDCQILAPRCPQASAEEISCAGIWRAPQLTLSNLQTRLGQNALRVQADLDVASRALKLGLTSDVDPHWLGPLLPPEIQTWLARCSWDLPPEFKLQGSVTLPSWVDRERKPDWRDAMMASLDVAGDLSFPHGGTFQFVSFLNARAHFTCSNLFLSVPDLEITRPEGCLDVSASADQRSQAFHVKIGSTVDPNFLRPLFPPRQQSAFNLFGFTQAPNLEAEVWGQGQDLERIGIKAQVAITNFTFREQTVRGLQTAVEYTNRVVFCSAPRIQRADGVLSADAVVADFAAQRVYLTNGYSTSDPMFIARCIGPHIVRAIEAYRFGRPPVARVQGVIPMYGEEGADLNFDLDGGPFQWWRFNLAHIVGHVHWLGERLDLRNIRTEFYGGQAGGFAQFDFHPGRETDYKFAFSTTNSSLRPLMRDMFTQTNHLEGTLNGNLVIAKANTLSLQSWYGYGNLDLRDGLIWEIPIFGVFSDVLNGLVPGLGSSRANAGTGNFVITNGVIRTDDLEIRETGTRLQYRGTVDFDGRVNARVEAGLMRDMWVVGPVVSTVFWPVTKLFEYKVTGTLGKPKAEPVFLVPKVLLLPFQIPFHPLRTLKGLLPEGGTTRTNGPPLTAPKQE